MDEKNRIMCVKSSKIGLLTLLKMKIYMMFHYNSKIAFDMKHVKNIKENFLNFIKEYSNKNKISLFNINSEIMALMDIRNYDKYIYIYADESDFIQNSRAIVNRKFKVY